MPLYKNLGRPGTLSAQISSLRPHNRFNRCRGHQGNKTAAKDHGSGFLLSYPLW